jgi:cyanobactin maturation PatA/PatG family protease
VYALGQLGHDFGTEACLDAFKQRMRLLDDPYAGPYPEREPPKWTNANSQAKDHLCKFLEIVSDEEPWHAASLMWTLNLDEMPLYVLRPEGPFAREVFCRLVEFFRDQLDGCADRVGVAGTITGQATLLGGRRVPVINPDMRGLCNWDKKTLKKAVIAALIATGVERDEKVVEQGLDNLLDRIYSEMRNSGRAPAERALNYAGTNLFQCADILSKVGTKTALDTISVQPSTLCRPGSECWDIILSFFDPNPPTTTVRKTFRYTIDVGDVIPVTVGELRSWDARAS